MPQPFRRVSHALCPIVQRIAIALAERASVRDAVGANHDGRLADFLRRKGGALVRMMEHACPAHRQPA